MTGGGAIAEAVGVMAEKGAALADPEAGEGVKDFYRFGDGLTFAEGLVFDLGDGLVERGAFGVFDGVFDEGLVVVGTIDVGAHFPDVAGHVVEAEAVGWKTLHWRSAGIAVESGVLLGEVALEGVGGPFVAFGFGLVAPDKEGVVEISAGGAFPFGFGGKTLFGPFAVGFGVFFGHADDGVVHFVLDGAVGAGGMLPIGAWDELPPLPFRSGLPFVDFLGGCFKNEGAGFELVCGGVGKVLLGEATFTLGLIAGGLNEFGKLSVGDFGGIDEEGRDGDLIDGLFLGVAGGSAQAAIFAAGVGATGNEGHAGGRGGLG